MALAEPIGVAGCGAMGLPMARCLRKAGFEVLGYDIRPREEFGDFSPHMAADAQVLANRCPVVISVVRNFAETEELCFGANGLFTGSEMPETFIVSSTLSPKMMAILRERVPAAVRLVDAPMSGAPYRAVQGTLTFMLGGDRKAIDPLMPAFKAMGTEINHLGPLGQGMMCKVLNNMLAATSTIAVREVLEAADALGFSRDTLLEVAKTSSGATWFGDNIGKISWAKEGYSIINTIGILEKDVNSLLEATADYPELRINEFARAVIRELRNLAEEK